MAALNMEGFGMINNEMEDVEKEDNKNPGDDKEEETKNNGDVDGVDKFFIKFGLIVWAIGIFFLMEDYFLEKCLNDFNEMRHWLTLEFFGAAWAGGSISVSIGIVVDPILDISEVISKKKFVLSCLFQVMLCLGGCVCTYYGYISGKLYLCCIGTFIASLFFANLSNLFVWLIDEGKSAKWIK